MNKRRGLCIGLLIAMIVFGFLMSVLSYIFINQASVDIQYPNAGIGTFIAWILNIVLILFALIGLLLEYLRKRTILRVMMFLLLIAALIDVIPSSVYGLFTLPVVIALPAIFLLTIK